MPPKTSSDRIGNGTSNTPQRSLAATLIAWIAAHRTIVLGLALASTIAASTVALLKPGTLIESDLSVLHPRPNPALTAQHDLVEIFGASNDPWLVHLTAATDTELLSLAHEVRQRLAAPALQETGVSGTFGLAAALPDPSIIEERRVALASLNADEIVRIFHAALEQSALNPDGFSAYEEFLRSLLTAAHPPTIETLRGYEELADLVLPIDNAAQHKSEAITAVFFSRIMNDREARDRAIDAIRTALAGLPGATLTGLSVVGHDLERQVKSDLARSLWIANTLVLACVLAYFRRVKHVLLAAIPPAFAALVLYAGMQLLDIRLNLVNLVGLPLLLGIGVDNGVFLTSLIIRRDDSAPLLDRMAAAAHAIIMTTLTTALTFGSLAITSTPAIRSLGILMAIGVTAALTGALGILCPLLIMLSPKRSDTRDLSKAAERDTHD